ncbi:hypothetical protein K466DRAFT_664886 [Polyporus arcularius HHB13444]|uniref:BAH-domain-containing protein n=1 Tax=Polyporus arcularius HHB13444 TaxID=1314778 RepID=A0A5C3P8H8_9APHY|nr:hypothetical protein K466DRAFT_664886 [Polyporus arcularius HHB13444]
MPVNAAQKTAINEVVNALTGATSRRTKRRLADMFLDLVDRDSWPEYYEVIPQPRCINGVKANLSQNKYKNALDAFQDLNLVFLNALYYNQEGSQIAKDAATLKGILENEWRARSVLPPPPPSPATSAPQDAQPKKEPKERAAATPAPVRSHSSAKLQPAPAAPPRAHVNATPSTSSQVKEVVKQKSPERSASPDMDVDIGGTPEPELTGHDAARDGESEEIVRQLEKSLPRWEGFDDVGWAEDITPDRMLEIVVTLSKYRDEHGNKLAASLEAVPEETSIPELSFTSPLSLQLIESRARMKYYETSQAFDKEMAQLFLKARRWYEIGTEPYGNVVALQRFYQALTSPNPPAAPYVSNTKFAALPAGPGTATSLSAPPPEGMTGPALTTIRLSLRDKKLLDEVHYKGWTIRIADWLHLSNPDDPSRPIVGHVFKCFVSEEPQRKGQLGVSVCWYFRPEQTLHPADRQFFENEVFKSSHFADHPLEDILEKVACQFTVRHARGRPRPPFWYPGWPLYVCDSRYNDRERAFVKIKNWNSCIPEEFRKKAEFMPIYPFERAVMPRRVPSPFLTNPKLKAPGAIIDAVPGEKEKEKAESEKPDSGSGRSKRPKRAAVTKAEDQRAAAKAGVPYVPPIPLSSTSTQQPALAPYMQVAAPREDRSIVAAAGGLAALGSSAIMEELPAETARHFDRDPETNEVLWFGAPPVDIVHTPPPQYSLKYLAFLARKRKAALQGDQAHPMDVDGEAPAPKRRKMPPTATETLEALLKEHGLWN